MRNFIFSLLAGAFLSGCASRAPMSNHLLNSPPSGIPESARLDHVPLISQTEGYCGPAAMTMAMQAAGKMLTIEELGPEIITPSKKGALPTDMISASRRHGMMAVTIESLDGVVQEIASGHPVIVFENLALSWYPRWHYAVVTGYDLRQKNIMFHSAGQAFSSQNLGTFEYSWKLADYWGVVILNPGELSTSADELAHVTAAAGLEQAGRWPEAERSYLAILDRWPESFASLIGLGNVTYLRGDVKASIYYLSRATQLKPESPVAQHNLRVARHAQSNHPEVQDRAQKARAER